MKNYKFLIAMILSVIHFPLLAQQVAESDTTTGYLTVMIEGLKNDKGNVVIGLFPSKESWDGKADKLKGAALKIENEQAKWFLDNIPYGEYAIRLYHAENEDDKLNTNFLGIPKESYAFSNNAKGRFGPPSFDKAKFTFNCDNTIIKINIK